jgi:hypothetical protein
MSAKVLWAAEENVAEDLYKCSFLGLLLTPLALRDVIQGTAIAIIQKVLQGDVALMLATYFM